MKKYIKQIDKTNFIYPNNTIAEYDLEIIHDINNNSVMGDVTNFTTQLTGGNIVVSFNYTWLKNGAEVYIDGGGNLHILSVHMLEPSKTYFKPWRCLSGLTTTNITATTITNSSTITITPSMMGVSSFGFGIYNFEIRLIGRKSVLPICIAVNVTS